MDVGTQSHTGDERSIQRTQNEENEGDQGRANKSAASTHPSTTGECRSFFLIGGYISVLLDKMANQVAVVLLIHDAQLSNEINPSNKLKTSPYVSVELKLSALSLLATALKPI